MKLPVLWIVAAMAAGIAASGRWQMTPKFWVAATSFVILAAGIFLWRNFVRAAWALALFAWFTLGGMGFAAQRAAVPANHVTRLIARGAIDTTEPLHWRGRLREDPIALPWGTRYEIDLEEVEIAGATLPVRGGLRTNLYGNSRVHRGRFSEENVLRAGDQVEALLRAAPPRNFLDPGAFDTKAYLAGQNIDLVGSLRSTELLRVISRPSPTISQSLARERGDLLSRLDALFPQDPAPAALLRAMLLGDRSFVDSNVVVAFQKTAAYHVLVVAGLHIGALVVFLFWVCRRLRFSPH